MTDEPAKRKRGRPAGRVLTEVVPLRMSAEQMSPLAAWAKDRGLTLSEAARLIITERVADDAPQAPPAPERDYLWVATNRMPADPFADVSDPSERARLLAPTIRALIGVNVEGLNALARGLNASGVKAPEGGQWYPKTVARVLEHLGITARGVEIEDSPDA